MTHIVVAQFKEYYIYLPSQSVQSHYLKNVIEMSYLVFRQFLPHVLRLEQVHTPSYFDFFSQDPSNSILNLTFYSNLPEILQNHCYSIHYNALVLKEKNNVFLPADLYFVSSIIVYNPDPEKKFVICLLHFDDKRMLSDFAMTHCSVFNLDFKSAVER